MNEPNRALLRAKKQQALDRIYTYHLRPWCGSVGNTFFISDTYPGLWLEHTFDAIAWAGYEPEQHDVSRSQVRLFLSQQKPDGQLPCYIWKDKIGYSQIQECVSFGRLCIEAAEQNPQDAVLLADAYEGCKKWDAWLCQHRMTCKTGLIEMFCGFDTGHDNSSRLDGMKYPNNICEDAAVPPKDDDLLPVLAPDMNAVFYGDRMALAEMAERLDRPRKRQIGAKRRSRSKTRFLKSAMTRKMSFFTMWINAAASAKSARSPLPTCLPSAWWMKRWAGKSLNAGCTIQKSSGRRTRFRQCRQGIPPGGRICRETPGDITARA